MARKIPARMSVSGIKFSCVNANQNVHIVLLLNLSFVNATRKASIVHLLQWKTKVVVLNYENKAIRLK